MPEPTGPVAVPSLEREWLSAVRRCAAAGRQAWRELRATSATWDGASMAELNPALAPPLPVPWDEAWRRRREMCWGLWGSFFVIPPLAVSLMRLNGAVAGAVGLCGFALFVISVLRLALFRCPRCGRPFDTVRKSKRRRSSNLFTRHCLFCGLKAGTRS